MAKRIKIRKATAYDVVDICKLLVQGNAEQGEDIFYPRVTDDRIKQVGHVLTIIDRGFVVVADMLVVVGKEPTGQRGLVGAIGMGITKESWSVDWCLCNEWTYILPDYREGALYGNMMTAVEDFADSKINPDTGFGLPILMSVISGRDTNAKDKLLERRGYQHGGGNFVRAPYHEQKAENIEHDSDPELVRVGE